MAITWVRGDKPLPLHVGMDLTGATVEALVRDYDDPDAAFAAVSSTVTGAAAGDLEADTSALTLDRYEIRVKVIRGGTLVATFPNNGDRTLLTLIP